MAKKVEPKAAAGVAAADLRRVVNDIKKHKETASESSGLAGQASKDAIERYGLDRWALSQAARLDKLEISKAQGSIRSFMDYVDKLGLLNQVDAFDDLIPTLKRIVERAENVRPPHGEPPSKVLSSLLDGAPATAN